MGPFWEILEKMVVKTRFGWDPFCSWWIAEGSINGTYGVPLTPAPEKWWVGFDPSPCQSTMPTMPTMPTCQKLGHFHGAKFQKHNGSTRINATELQE